MISSYWRNDTWIIGNIFQVGSQKLLLLLLLWESYSAGMKSLSTWSAEVVSFGWMISGASPSLDSESSFPWRSRKPIMRLCWQQSPRMVELFVLPQKSWKAIVRLCWQQCPLMVLLFRMPQRSWKAIVRLHWQLSLGMVVLFSMPKKSWKAIMRLCWQRCARMVKLFCMPQRNWKAIVRLCWRRSPKIALLLTMPQIGWRLMRRWCGMPSNSHQTDGLDWRFPFSLGGAALRSTTSGISVFT